MRQAVSTSAAPTAIGPYSQAIRAGQLLFVSGQVALDPASGQLIEGNVAAEAHRVMQNLGEILKAAGVSYDAVVRSTVFLTDINDFATVNEVYGSYFTSPAPARATVQVAGLPKNARVEIDVIAMLSPAG